MAKDSLVLCFVLLSRRIAAVRRRRMKMSATLTQATVTNLSLSGKLVMMFRSYGVDTALAGKQPH